MIDSHFRTIVGLQTLIQKEWVVMGHQFCTRLGHVNNTDSVKVKYIYLMLYKIELFHTILVTNELNCYFKIHTLHYCMIPGVAN